MCLHGEATWGIGPGMSVRGGWVNIEPGRVDLEPGRVDLEPGQVVWPRTGSMAQCGMAQGTRPWYYPSCTRPRYYPVSTSPVMHRPATYGYTSAHDTIDGFDVTAMPQWDGLCPSRGRTPRERTRTLTDMDLDGHGP